ncbi:MAG: DUF805 domain-containing protein [Burkholderiaceae bacterium]
MKIQEAVEVCVTKKYVTFEGTATRSEFWWFILFVLVVDVLLSAISRPLAHLFVLGMLCPQLAVAARRLHDIGRSGWMMLIGLIPLVGAIVLIALWAREGKTPATPT